MHGIRQRMKSEKPDGGDRESSKGHSLAGELEPIRKRSFLMSTDDPMELDKESSIQGAVFHSQDLSNIGVQFKTMEAHLNQKAVVHLRELIRTRYVLDVGIWDSREVQEDHRPTVIARMQKADRVLQEIYSIINDLDETGTRTTEESHPAWELKETLEKDGKRPWGDQPPWAYLYGKESVESHQSTKAVTALLELLEGETQIQEEAVMVLIKNLEYTPSGVQRKVASLLGKQNQLPKKAVTALEDLLKNKYSKVRSNALSALQAQRQLPETAITALLQLLGDPFQGIQAATILGIQRPLSEAAMTNLINLLGDKRYAVRSQAAYALQGQNQLSEATVTDLVQLLEGTDHSVRSGAATVLGKQIELSETTIISLGNLIRSKDFEVRSNVVSALQGQSRLPETVLTALTSLLEETNYRIRSDVIMIFKKQITLPETVISALVPLLAHKDYSHRYNASLILRAQSQLPATVMTSLVQLLNDSNLRSTAQFVLQGRSTETEFASTQSESTEYSPPQEVEPGPSSQGLSDAGNALNRSRAVTTCRRCRSAKIECDGKSPACFACKRAGRASECSNAGDQEPTARIETEQWDVEYTQPEAETAKQQNVANPDPDPEESELRVLRDEIDSRLLDFFRVRWRKAKGDPKALIIMDQLEEDEIEALRGHTVAIRGLMAQQLDLPARIAQSPIDISSFLLNRANSGSRLDLSLDDRFPETGLRSHNESDFTMPQGQQIVTASARREPDSLIPKRQELLVPVPTLENTSVENVTLDEQRLASRQRWRYRKALLCSHCQKHKLHCDGKQPCNQCQSRSWITSCSYRASEDVLTYDASVKPHAPEVEANKITDPVKSSLPLSDEADTWIGLSDSVMQGTEHVQILTAQLVAADMIAQSLTHVIDSTSLDQLVSSTVIRQYVEQAKSAQEILFSTDDTRVIAISDRLVASLDQTEQRLRTALMKHHYAMLKAKGEVRSAEQTDEDEVEKEEEGELRDVSMPLLVTRPSCVDLTEDHRAHRVRWTCVCGVQLFDDYVELVPGGVAKLQAHLADDNKPRSSNARLSYWVKFIKEAFTSLSPTSSASASTIVSASTSHSGDSDLQSASPQPGKDSNLGMVGQHNVEASTEGTHSTATSPASSMPERILYLLLCFPIGFTGLRLHHAQILLKQLSNDRQLFQLLARMYTTGREHVTLTSRMSLRTVTRVSLSHFLVDLSDLVDLKPHSSTCAPITPGCRCLPPADMISPAPSAEYVCDPAEPDYMPPFGVNYLTHYFQNPSHLNPSSSWVLRQVPKRMAGQLMAGADAGFAKGWGLAFEEGWDRRRIGQRVLVLVVLGSLLFGVLYAILKKDIQSAFSISACVISALAIVGGYFGSGEPRGFVHV